MYDRKGDRNTFLLSAIFKNVMTFSPKLNDLRIMICLRKSEAAVDRISVCTVMKN